MCDTMVALGSATADGRVLFAKNSNRQPNECHLMIRIPSKRHPRGAKVQCTYTQLDQAEETNAVLLLKPFWIWGAEMGCNEHGLNIGNEAVFTKESYGRDSLIGMDMLRLALERCKTSREALDYMVRLLEEYGQGGNCGYQKKFTYHNSFLISDRSSAWVLETAGAYWAALQVKDVYSISNRLSIGRHYDLAHSDLVKHAVDKGWCRNEQDFNFSQCYSNPLITRLSGAAQRQSMSRNCLEQAQGRMTAETMIRILRSHQPPYETKRFKGSTLTSLCCHGGFLYGDHTTGSYVAHLGGEQDLYWVTGASTPCLALFKPLWLLEQEPITFGEHQQADAVHYWKTREEFHRAVLEGRISNLADYEAARNTLEKNLQTRAAKASNPEAKLQLMRYALSEEEALQTTFLYKANRKPQIRGGAYYRHYWKKMNETLDLSGE